MSIAPDPDSVDICISTGTLSQDGHDSGPWDLTAADSLTQSWPWNEAADDLNHETAIGVQRPNSERQPSKIVPDSEARDLCQELTELSNALCKDVHHVVHRPQATLQPSSCLEDGIIQRTLRSSGTLRSLLDELRMKASDDRGLRTPASLQLPNLTVGNAISVDSTSTGGSVRIEQLDHQLNMIMALHIVTSYVCLNRIFKAILNRIFSAVSDGSEVQLSSLPGIQMEGLACDNDHLRVRLFAETCMHLATEIHKRLERSLPREHWGLASRDL